MSMEMIRKLDALEKTQARLSSRDYPYQSLYFNQAVGVFIRPFTATLANVLYASNPANKTIFISTIEFMVLVGATNNGTNFWTITVNTISSANASSVMGSVNTSAGAAGVWLPLTLTVNQSFTLTVLSTMRIDVTKTLAPGNLFFDGLPCVWFSLT